MMRAAVLLAALAVVAAARPAAAARGLQGLESSLPAATGATAVQPKFLSGFMDDAAKAVAGGLDNAAPQVADNVVTGGAASAASGSASKLPSLAKDTGMEMAEAMAEKLENDKDSKPNRPSTGSPVSGIVTAKSAAAASEASQWLLAVLAGAAFVLAHLA
ncbi:hypothetical protein C2E21_3414 [Chlorella sorokiniana]|uniref:Uncharacterized protein n=1 Tax=Chlorella sorokiniana TaxID=3076 RepID=A0A2P6TUQ8_CHLSO|nr:hypothetical protein C2E21_3414 [Chlorella sorokiniana]|eukprot:PRW57805.1 hypothetical protein C2E21_3414 [Chlorella sorokiniana]